jgi:hypothetical protein
MTRSETVFEQVLTCRDAAFLVGLPQTEEQWWTASLHADSFARGYSTPAQYLSSLRLDELAKRLNKLASRTSLRVGWPFTPAQIAEYTEARRLLLVVSHLPAGCDAIECGDGFLSPDEFWGAFQPKWNGIVYLAGCYSQSFRDAYIRRFGMTTLPGLNGMQTLSADFWLPYYIADFLPLLSDNKLPFGQFAITMNARIADYISREAQVPV